MRIKVSRGRTRTLDYQAERMDVGYEFDIPDETTQEDIDQIVEITEKQLEAYLAKIIGD